MATSSSYRFEFSVTFKGRKVKVYSDEQNENRTVKNYFYHPLCDLQTDQITVDCNVLYLPVTMWSEELENVIEQKLKTSDTEQQISVQMMLFDEVKLEWRAAPPGVEIPDHGIPFNHQPQNQVFIVKCKDDKTAENYKSGLEQFQQSILAGLNVIGFGQDGTQTRYKMNTGISGSATVTRQQLVILEARLNKRIDDVIGRNNSVKASIDDLKGRIEKMERSYDDVIDSLVPRKQVQIDFTPHLVTSLPGEQAGIIYAQWYCNEDSFIHYRNDNSVNMTYIKCDCEEIQGLATDSDGFLFVVVKKNSEFILRKYKDDEKLFEEEITDILPGGCETLIIRDRNIYVHTGRDVQVLCLLENPENSLIDRCRVKKYQLPGGDNYSINCLDVDSKGRMFLYCHMTHRLLFLTSEAELISCINTKDCDELEFDPCEGFPCVISNKHVLLSVCSVTDNRGTVISIRYDDDGFIDPPGRIVLNSTDSMTYQIHHVFDSDAVVIHHRDISNKQQSLRFYNINTVFDLRAMTKEVIGRVHEVERSTDDVIGRVDKVEKSTGDVIGRVDEAEKSTGDVIGRVDKVEKSTGDVIVRVDEVEKSTGDVIGRVDEVEKSTGDVIVRVDEVERSTGDVIGRVDRVERSTGDVIGRVDRVERSTVDVIGRVDEVERSTVDVIGRVDKVERSTVDVLGRVDKVEKSTGDVIGRVDKVEKSTGDVIGRVDKVEKSTGDVIGRVDKVEKSTGDVIGRVDEGERFTDDVIGRVDKVEKSTGDVIGRVDKVEKSTGDVIGRVDKVEKSTGDVIGRVDKVEKSTGDVIRRVDKVEKSTGDVIGRVDKVEKSTGDVIGRVDEVEKSTGDVIGRIDNVEISTGVIDSLKFNKQLDTDFRPHLVTSIPGEHEGEQSRVICAHWGSTDYIYSMNDDNEMKRYIKIDGWIQGLAADGNGFLFVVVWKNSESILRKYKNEIKLFEENITDLLSVGCGSFVIRDYIMYIQTGDSNIHVLPLRENPVNKLIDRNRVKKYQLPGGDYKYINSLNVDTRGRIFVYCSRTRRLLYLTAEAEQISFINMKDFGLTFDPLVGSPCVISDRHVLLSVRSNTGNRGAVISIRYNDVGFIDHPRIILNSTDSRTFNIHHVFNSNAVVIHHWDYSDKQNSLRFYNINTEFTLPI
ncbi:uncharacterized protein LOC141910146 [Tubulanus polymorphus]|uniref:uncharacterized protein LOC141910146 n=1 Tax=Tubulanus polymorphus TaxID=672921 RepID=UPI003DA59814